MNSFLKFFTRFLLIIIVFLFYFKYRNNQCIKNQNCQPYFISHFLSFKKNFKLPYLIIYKIQDNLPNIDITTEPSFTIEDLQKNKDLTANQINSVTYIANNFKAIYDDLALASNNNIIIKKFTLKNTSKTPIKVFPKMTFEPEESRNYVKIYNCFCDSQFIIEPLSTKDIFIYFKIKDIRPFKKEENMQSLSIKISI